MNLESIDDGLAKLKADGAIQREYELRLGEPVSIKGFSIQIDDIDPVTKRGYHLDGSWPPTFKAFIYLTDVEVFGAGPYTVIPGSHRHVFRKAWNEFLNVMLGRGHSDMCSLYSDRQSKSFLAKAGTLILSTQDLVHKGWHEQDESKRYNMIVFIQLTRFFDGKPILLGSNRIREPAHA
jgi:hypothetical protein